MNPFVFLRVWLGIHSLSYNLANAGNLAKGHHCVVPKMCMCGIYCTCVLDVVSRWGLTGHKCPPCLLAKACTHYSLCLHVYRHVCVRVFCGVLPLCWQTPKCFNLSSEETHSSSTVIQTLGNKNKAKKQQKCEEGKTFDVITWWLT